MLQQDAWLIERLSRAAANPRYTIDASFLVQRRGTERLSEKRRKTDAQIWSEQPREKIDEICNCVLPEITDARQEK